MTFIRVEKRCNQKCIFCSQEFGKEDEINYAANMRETGNRNSGPLALHYFLPDTTAKIFSRNRITRKFMGRMYKEAFIFVFGKVKEFFFGWE